MKTETTHRLQRCAGSASPRAVWAGLIWLASAGALFAQPTIVSQPVDQTVVVGSTATFRVSASGVEPLGYQWRDYTSANQFTTIPGAISEVLVLENVQPTSHRFGVVVSNASGSVTSSLAKLIFLTPPVILTQPVSQTVTQGAVAAFAVSATTGGAPPLAYQWRFRGEALPGATQTNLVFGPAQVSHVGDYSVVISNRVASVTSQVARLSLKVLIRPPFDPQLDIARMGGEVRLSWRGEGELLGAPSSTGPWDLLALTGESYVMPATRTATFFQLRNPNPRTVETFVPSSYRPGMRLPLVIALHGYAGSGLSLETAYIHFQSLADSRGFIYCLPDATLSSSNIAFWNSGDACCNFFGSRVDDVAFLRSLIEEVDRLHGVDRKRIHLFGYSNGGFMSYRMACAASDLIASIASLAGTTSRNSTDCQPTEPVSILHLHGTADNVVFYNGGRLCTCVTGVSPATPPAASALETVQTWAGYNGCGDPVTSPAPIFDLVTNLAGNDTVVTEYQNHPAGGAVELWAIQGGDHGPSFSVAAWARIVDWLLAHPKP